MGPRESGLGVTLRHIHDGTSDNVMNTAHTRRSMAPNLRAPKRLSRPRPERWKARCTWTRSPYKTSLARWDACAHDLDGHACMSQWHPDVYCISRVQGGYGSVYKASWRGATVAVKYIICRTDDSDSLGRAIREVVVSKKMSHPNVVRIFTPTCSFPSSTSACVTSVSMARI